MQDSTVIPEGAVTLDSTPLIERTTLSERFEIRE